MEQKYSSCDFSLLTSAVLFMGKKLAKCRDCVLRYGKYHDVRVEAVAPWSILM